MGIDLVNEKELVLIVSRTSEKNAIMKAIMDNADKKAGSIVFSLPVTDTAACACWTKSKKSNFHLSNEQKSTLRQAAGRGFFCRFPV